MAYADREGQAAQFREEQRLGMAPKPAPSSRVAATMPITATSSTTSSMKGARRIVFLVDNGSVRAAATLSLRSLAKELENHLCDGTAVVGVSARWSDRVLLKFDCNRCV